MNQTEGKIKLRGKIYGIDKDKVERTDKQIRLRLRLQSTKENSVFLTVNQWVNAMKQAYVSKWLDDEETYDGKKVPWSDRYNYIEDGYTPAGAIRTKKKGDDDTMLLLPSDFIDFVLEEFKDGDSVFVMADATVSQSSDGKKTYTNYDVTTMYPTSEDIDFKSDDFEEINALQFKNMIFNSATDLDEKTAVVFYAFDWNEKPIEFTTMTYDENISKHFLNNASFGDTMDIELIAQNKPIYADGNETEVEDSGSLGKSSGQFSGSTIVGNQNELELIYVTNIQEEVYTRDEIMTQDDKDKEIVEKAKGKKGKSNKKPWEK